MSLKMMDALTICKSDQGSQQYVWYIPCIKKDKRMCIYMHGYIYYEYMCIYVPVFLEKYTKKWSLRSKSELLLITYF